MLQIISTFEKTIEMKKLLVLFFWASAVACSDRIIYVSGGQIQGVTSQKRGVTVFRGIPYAAPPVGQLRWRAPETVKPWEGVRVCDSFGPIEWQPGNKPGTFYGDEFYWEGTPEQDEDCLYLNVWAPSKSIGRKGAKLPVAMWIHGGAFINGYGYEVTMDGDEWASRGVILVTINYRLGAMGYLSHPALTEEQGTSGNYGLLDQIAAIQWIRDNIAKFGGDPSNITIFGQSAGAMSVKNLLISPLSRDLFSKAIIQSGGGLSIGIGPESIPPQNYFDEQGRELMDFIGLNTLEEMRFEDVSAISDAPSRYAAEGDGWILLRPHPDGKVLTQTFAQAVESGQIADVPIMIGYNKDDMQQLAGESVDRFCAVRDSLGGTVYEYEFLRELPTDSKHPGSDAGAFHSAELWYMFGTLSRSWRPFVDADYALSARMLDAWTSFCRTGDPGWPAYKHDAPYKQLFDIEPDN